MVLSKFDSLSVRPPTPPKDLKDLHDQEDIDEALEFMSDPFGTSELPPALPVAKPSLSTPASSPSSDNIPSSSSKKRVNFEIPTCIAPDGGRVIQAWTPVRSSPLRPLPQTRVSKPLKSILKPSDPASTPPPAHEGAAAHKFKSFAEMLESAVKILALGSRPSKLDVYIALEKTLGAYEKVPDTQSLVDKLPLLCGYVERDMQAVGINGTGLDILLNKKATTFLINLIRIPEVKAAMTDDFCARIVDHSVRLIENSSMPKQTINTGLALLAQQSFRVRTMTQLRVEMLLDLLDSIHDRVSGLSVQTYRIRIYRKFIQQRPDLMTKHTERWMKHVIKAMLSKHKDIRQNALDTGMAALKSIGNERIVINSVLSIMNRVKNDGKTFSTLLALELEEMLGSDMGPLVPQIWGVMTAFLRDCLQENRLTAMREWLKLFEKFFASDKEAVKVNLNIAANFLVYTVNIQQSTSTEWSKMFFKISQQQLRQPSHGRKAGVDTATSGYLTLLYYAFRPIASHTQLNRYWTEYIADFWRPLAESSPKHAIAACRVLSALFNGSRRPWNEQRALELRHQHLVQREELPLLDPKWVRKSLCIILHFTETLLDATPWTPDVGDDEPVRTMWIALLNSLVEASSQEVMATTETRDAIAHIINMLRRMWDSHTAKLAMPQHKEDSWAEKFCFLLETVVQKLGALQFAEKCLTRNGQDEFEVASTPSNRSRQSGPRISPLLYFIDLLVSRSEGKLSDSVRLRIVQLALEPCFNAQSTRIGKLELLRDCAATVNPATQGNFTSNFWDRIAALTRSCIQEPPSDSNERQSRQLGKEYDIVVEILALGDLYFLNAVSGHTVLSTFAETVRREAGDGAVVLAVVEKVSSSILLKTRKEDRRACLPFATILLNSLPKSIIRRILDQGRQNLYPSSPAPTRNQEFDPYNHFYSAINSIGIAAYDNMVTNDVESTLNFLIGLASSIQNSPSFMSAVYLRKIQLTLKPWIEDPKRILQKKDNSVKRLHAQVRVLSFQYPAKC
jgi:hypothetical protein